MGWDFGSTVFRRFQLYEAFPPITSRLRSGDVNCSSHSMLKFSSLLSTAGTVTLPGEPKDRCCSQRFTGGEGDL